MGLKRILRSQALQARISQLIGNACLGARGGNDALLMVYLMPQSSLSPSLGLIQKDSFETAQLLMNRDGLEAQALSTQQRETYSFIQQMLVRHLLCFRPMRGTEAAVVSKT